MATYSLAEYLEDDAIVLEDIRSNKHPNGKTYSFASPTFETGLWLKNLIEFGQRAALGVDIGDDEAAKLVLDDDAETDLYRRVMGDTFDKLRVDGVSWEHVQKIFTLLLKHWGAGQPVASALSEAQGEAQAQPNRAARRAKPTSSAPKAGSRSNRASGATAARTTSRASTRSSATSAKPRAAKAG